MRGKRMEYQEELGLAIKWAQENMPPHIKTLISHASYDLWHGPTWLDADGDLVSGYDSDAVKPFDFEAACQEIREWFDNNVSDIQIESWYDEETEEFEYETVDGSAGYICKAICGKLSEYL